jgi:hypothetical protein
VRGSSLTRGPGCFKHQLGLLLGTVEQTYLVEGNTGEEERGDTWVHSEIRGDRERERQKTGERGRGAEQQTTWRSRIQGRRRGEIHGYIVR